MDAHMPGSINVKLSEFVEGRWAIAVGPKKIKMLVQHLQLKPCLISARSLGFEDFHLATLLLN